MNNRPPWCYPLEYTGFAKQSAFNFCKFASSSSLFNIYKHKPFTLRFVQWVGGGIRRDPPYGHYWYFGPGNFFFFLQPYPGHMEAPRLEVKSELKLLAYTIATATADWATSVTYATAYGNTRSLIHWERPGIKPTSSWRQCQDLNTLSHNGNSWPDNSLLWGLSCAL